LIGMFTLGLTTSLHCVSMCGPMVMSCAIKDDREGAWHQSLSPQLAYQAAKILGYTLMGGVLGAIGAVFDLGGLRPWVMLGAGLFMIVLGLGLTGKVKWAQRVTPRTPKFLMTWIRDIRARGKQSCDVEDTAYDRYIAPTLLGLITFMMPCGALIAAYAATATAGSAAGGALGMLMFGLGTAPLMLVLGTATGLMKAKVRNRVMALLAVVVIIFGAIYVNRGLQLIGFPVTFQSVRTAVLGTGSSGSQGADTQYTTAADGVVEVPLVIQNTQYVPQQLNIPADKPVRLVVDRREAAPCSDQIVFPQLGVTQDLAPNGTTVVNLPATKAGTYSMTCGMGMMSGSLVVGGAVGASGGGVPAWFWLLVAAGAAGGAIWLGRDLASGKSSKRDSSSGPASKDNTAPQGRGTSDPSPKGGATAANVSGEATVFGIPKAEATLLGGILFAAVALGLILTVIF